MNSFKVTLFLLLTALICFGTQAQTSEAVSPEIVNATNNGDASKLATFFNNNIELVLPQKSGIFSQSQAEMVIKDFFTQNPPKGFRIIHKGNRQNASFAIGNYTSEKSTYRIYFLTKNVDKKLLIHQLRIEKQND